MTLESALLSKVEERARAAKGRDDPNWRDCEGKDGCQNQGTHRLPGGEWLCDSCNEETKTEGSDG